MKEYVTFELANKLCEKGFPQVMSSDKSYFAGDKKIKYKFIKKGLMVNKSKTEDDNFLIACPSVEQVINWLRTTYGIHILIDFFKCNGGTKLCWIYKIRYIKDDNTEDTMTYNNYDSFENARIAGIEYILEKLEDLKTF